jgi:hypothetical protein
VFAVFRRVRRVPLSRPPQTAVQVQDKAGTVLTTNSETRFSRFPQKMNLAKSLLIKPTRLNALKPPLSIKEFLKKFF